MTLAPILAAALAAEPVAIAAGGDLLLGRGVDGYLKENGADRVLGGVAQAMAGADLALANLEGPLALCPVPAAKRYPLLADPRWAIALRSAGIHVLSLANNHALDCGPEGLGETVRVLRAVGVEVAGIEDRGPQRPVVVERRNLRLGILAFSAVEDPEWSPRGLRYARLLPESLDQIAAARRAVDILLVSVHWGREDDPAALPDQREWARRIAAAGADVIVGHHAHVLQPVERVGKTEVFYGLGNLLFDRTGPAGAVARLSFGKDLVSCRLVPIRIRGGLTMADRSISCDFR